MRIERAEADDFDRDNESESCRKERNARPSVKGTITTVFKSTLH